MVQRWVFTELGTASPETYTVPINPNQGGTPAVRRNVFYANTSGPGGTPIMQAGRVEAQSIDFSGRILSQAQLTAMDKWARKNVTIQIVDDLNRTFVGIFTEFQPSRVRRSNNFWLHEFTARFAIAGLAPQGVPAESPTSVFYVMDPLARASAGSGTSFLTIDKIFGTEPRSGQQYINSTHNLNVYNTLNWNGSVGYAQRSNGSTSQYCFTGVKVSQTGDVLVQAVLEFTNVSGGHVGVYARNNSATPATQNNTAAFAGGGYMCEIFPATNKLQIARLGGSILVDKFLTYTIANNSKYFLAMRLVGSSISVYFTPYSGSDPYFQNGLPQTTPELTVNDNLYPNAGYLGFSTHGVDCAKITNLAARGL